MPLSGRNPEPQHYFQVEVIDSNGITIQRANMSSLPPIGYHFMGKEVVGGNIIKAQMSDANTSANITKATVVVR